MAKKSRSTNNEEDEKEEEEEDFLMNQSGQSVLYLITTVLIFVAAILMIVSFFSPYWIESDPDGDKDIIESYSDFERDEYKRLNVNINAFNNAGLWLVCFYRFKFMGDKDSSLSLRDANGMKTRKASLTGCFSYWSKDLGAELSRKLLPRKYFLNKKMFY